MHTKDKKLRNKLIMESKMPARQAINKHKNYFMHIL